MRVRTTLRSWWQACLDNDSYRVTFAALVCLVLSIPLSFPLNAWVAGFASYTPDSSDFNPLVLFVYIGVYWVLYTVFYCAITIWWYSRLDSADLHEKLRTTSRGPSTQRRWATAMFRSDGTMSMSLQMCLLALVFTIVVMTVPDFRGEFMMKVIAVAVSASNWAAVMVTQALAYARVQSQDAEASAITFAGTPNPVWGDYVTLSIGVSTMMGPADSQLQGRRVRTTLRWHALVSFAFNSMVIASLATLMLSN